MPCVTDDDSKAVKGIAEIQQQLQDAKREFDRWLAAGSTVANAAELIQRECDGKMLTDQLQALAIALELQRALASPTLQAQERTLAKTSPKKMKDFGYRSATVQFLGGLEIERMARYWCRSRARANKGKGSYFGLVLLGICDRTSPALAGEVAQLAAALSSFDDAQARLRQMGINMSIRCRELVDFHHVVEHVYALAALNTSWRGRCCNAAASKIAPTPFALATANAQRPPPIAAFRHAR